MISITRLNGKEMLVNAELIEFIESTPDTIITTSSGKKVIVRDSVEEVVRKVVEYRRLCFPEKRYKPLTEQEIQLYNKNVE
ncbi:flagellar FlbD family protein [candidate division KSB1 bacterium]|nr:flagellar FlbD family protein [candidate division KSB1 bacterium]MCH8285167.1 flagellar FlbD family protein [candidate division KSB1 bacterium]